VKDPAARRRFYAEDLAGEAVELSPAEAHHAADVLRLAPGAEVELFDGSGKVAVGTLEKVDRRRAVVRIRQRRQAARREPIVELAFAVPKGKRVDWLLEKVTELGAAKLTPVIFSRSVAAPKLSAHARGRWRGICIAAAKQCGAEFLPEIAAPVALDAFLSAVGGKIRLLGDPDSQTALPAALKNWSAGETITILIGPEGGLTAAERSAAVEAGFVPFRLGDFVLRIETAAAVLLATVTAICQA